MKSILIVLLVACIVGCGEKTTVSRQLDPSTDSQLKALSNEVVSLNSQILELRLRNDSNVVDLAQAADKELNLFRHRIETLEQGANKGEAYSTVDLLNPTFTSLDTDVGKIYIMAEKTEPYLDGFKIFLSVGNPTAANISGVEIIYSRFTKNGATAFATNGFPQTFRSGYWTPVQLVIAPALASEMRSLLVKLETKTVFLSTTPVSK